jgi:hypothetical protein
LPAKVFHHNRKKGRALQAMERRPLNSRK